MKEFSDDNDLIAAFRKNDLYAARHIYELHYRALCYYADRLIHNREQAQDIVADSFLKLLNKKEEMQTLSHIKTFLFTVVRNACIDYYRRENRHELSHREMAHLFGHSEPANDLELINAEVLQQLYFEITQLPTQCGQVFKLLFLHGMNTEQAAQALHITPKTVLNQKGKAIRLLRIALLRKGLLSAIPLFLFFESFNRH